MKHLSRRPVWAFIFTLLIALQSIAFAATAKDFEGKMVTEVNVTGNLAVPDSQVSAVLTVKTGDLLVLDKVKQDVQALYNLGYFADVLANFTEEPEGVKVTYTVLENPMLKDVVIEGNTKVTTDKLKSLLTAKTGTVLNGAEVNKGLKAIENYYYDQGYILAKVTDASMSPEGVLKIKINEGMVENLTVKGNEKTKDYVITRELKLKPGQPFNAKDARRSMQKVYNLGYFEDVNLKLNPGHEPNSVIAETSVVEQKTGTFSIGGGYSSADGLVGIIELGDSNFRGTGDKVKLHWEFGGKASNKNYEVSYTHPWLDDKQTSVGFSFYNMTNQYSDYGLDGSDRTLRSTYDRKRQGYEFTFGRPQGEFVENYVTFKSRRDTHVGYVEGPVNYTNSSTITGHTDAYGKTLDTNYLQDNFGLTRSVTLNRIYDSRDNVFNPTEGQRLSLSAEFAGKALGGDFNFNRYTLEERNYYKVGHDHVIALKATMGYADGNLSEYGKFSVGGPDSLRGYNDDQFKGDKMLAASVEYRFPIVNKVQGVVFSDIGKAWTGEGYKLNDLKSSVGVGIRVTTPIGPIRIDYAKGEEGAKTHFSFGGQF